MKENADVALRETVTRLIVQRYIIHDS